MRPPRQDRSRDSADRVLDAVLALLATEGLGALTTARVARESGVSNGSIYHRFGSRRALLAAAFTRFQDRLYDAALARRAAAPPLTTLDEAVAGTVEAYRTTFESSGRVIRAFFTDAGGDDPAVSGPQGSARFAVQLGEYLAPVRDQVHCADLDTALVVVHEMLYGFLMVRTLYYGDLGGEVEQGLLRDAVRGVLDPTGATPR